MFGLWNRPHPFAVRGMASDRRFGSRKVSGWLWTEGHALVFSRDSERLALPLDGMRIARNRWWGRHIRFTHPDETGRTFYTGNTRILRDPLLTKRPGLVTQTWRAYLFLHRTRQILRIAVVAFVLTILLAPVARRWVVGKAVVYVPASYEHSLGEGVMKKVRREQTLVDDPAVLEPLRQITESLMKGVPQDEKHGPYQFFVALNPEVNAYAAPGGFIVINSGLILEAESAEEIAGVLAHEVAHAAHRHAMHGLVETVGAVTLLYVASETESDETLKWSLRLSCLKFSRDHETDADLTGLGYLRQAHIRPDGMLKFFERLSRSSDALENAGTNLLSTHPLPADRLAGLKAELERLPMGEAEPIVLDVNLKTLQARLRDLQDAHLEAQQRRAQH